MTEPSGHVWVAGGGAGGGGGGGGGGAGSDGPSAGRSDWQKRHLIAAALMVSAQNGQRFSSGASSVPVMR